MAAHIASARPRPALGCGRPAANTLAMTRFAPVLVLIAAALPAAAAPYIPRVVTLERPTAPVAAAHTLWSLRAAANVAALQCQFSPYLRAVPRYNALIRQHAREFAGAYALLGKHFARARTPRDAAAELDRYNTRLYQSFASIDAQEAFCRRTADAVRSALIQPVGKLGPAAPAELAEVRASLTPVEPAPLPVSLAVAGPDVR